MKRTLSFILALVLLIGLMPMQAFATEVTDETQVTEGTAVTEEAETTAATEIAEVTEEVVVSETEAEHTHSYTPTVTAPTCTEQGYTTYTCECGDSYVDDYTDAAGHTYANGICTGCDATASPYLQQLPENILGCTNLYNSLVPVKGYYTATKYDTSNGAVLSVVIPVKPGDRIAASSFGSVSENMGSVNGIRVTYLLGDKIVISLSAGDVYNGYTNNGYITVPDGVDAVCIPWWAPSDSNWLTLSQISKNFASHSPKTVSAQAPTCTENGYTAGEVCEICDASLGSREEIPATGHDYNGNTCTICGTVNVLAILDGKYVSILGDSISTFNGYSNDATVNTTIGGNGPRYDAGTADTKPGSYCLLESVDDTWWMHFANRSGMKLLVNNSWAGSQVFGGQTSDGRVIPAAYLERCINLHDDTVENNPNNAPINPDIIFVYLGINDYNFNRSNVGEGTVDYATLINSDGTYATPTTFGEAYAILLHKMQQAYPNAQIFAMTLLPENLYSVDKTAWEQHNAYIRAAAEYYDIPVVDLAEKCAITWDNYSGYMMDKIHPTTAGMELISDCIEAELVAYYTANPPHTHNYTSTVTAPTCTEKGYTTYTCECGDSYVDDYVDATGEHSYENGVCAGCGVAQWDTDGDGALEILAIGNSFSVDALEYAYQIAQNLGIEEIVIGNLYIGGCSLNTHATNAAGDLAKYTYYYNDNGTWTSTKSYKISTALDSRSWDYVSMQQASNYSGVESTYNENLTNLIAYVQARSDAKLVWHMTWAYQQDSTHSAFPTYNKDQMTMYNAIVSAVQNKIVTNSAFDLIVPNGTAVQNSRTSLLGDTTTRDGYHMSYTYGRYLTGMMLIKTVTGLSVDNITYTPSGVDAEKLAIAIESVNNAAVKPFEVTESAYVEEEPEIPDEGYILLQSELYKGAFWYPINADRYNELVYDMSNSHQYFATIRFTRETLPVGSIIVLADGWQYRPDGWITDAVQTGTRESVTTESYVVITEDWWGDYTIRAFNISKVGLPDLTNVSEEEVRAAFQIYVPEASHNHTYDDGLCTLCGAIADGAIWQITKNGIVIGAYADLQAAVDDCEAGGTILLTADCAATAGVVLENGITIDGGNHLVDISSCSNAFITVDEGTEVTIRDLKLDGCADGFEVDYDAVTYTNYTIPLKAGSLANDPKANQSAIISSGILVCENVDVSNRYTASVGGAMQILAGSVKLTDCDFTHNYGTSKGGALFIGSNFGARTAYPVEQVAIQNCTFTKNYTGHGGAIYAYNMTEMIVENTRFTENTANGGKGGAIDLFSETTKPTAAMALGLDFMQTTIRDCTFRGNWAGNDGFAIQSYDSDLYIYDSEFNENVGVHPTSSVGTVSIEAYRHADESQRIYTLMDGCLFEGNRGPCAVYGDHSSISDLDVSNCVFRNNSGNDSFLLYAATSNITNCQFIGETMTVGVIDARIYDNYEIPPLLTLTNVAFTDCTAPAEILTRKQNHNESLNAYQVVLQGITNGDIAIWDNNAVSIQGTHSGNVQLDYGTARDSLSIGDNAIINGIVFIQPNDAEAAMGERFCVTVDAEGKGLKYQWYFRNAGTDTWHKSGVRDNTYDDVMTTARAGREVYCVITDANGNSVTTDTVKLICLPSEELAIVTQPTNGEAVLGERYCVTVEAKGEGLTYQWYFRNAGSAIWYKSSVTDNTYDDIMTTARAGREVYCVITDVCGNTVTTNTVKLIRVIEELVITKQPVDGEAALGENYCVTVEAKGEGLRYQWYFRNKGAKNWTKSGVTDNTYDDVMTTARAGREVYCVITDKYGNSVTTDIVKLIRVPAKLEIITQPTDAAAAFDEMFCATVEAKGEGLKYQWYYRNAGTNTWHKSGVRDNTYDDVMTKARNGREIYCVITDAYGNTVTTDIVKLIAVPKVELQLLSVSYESAAMGGRYCVTVEAQGEGLEYQWYFRNAGSSTWYKSSVTDNTYDDVMTTARANREVYCVITDAFGNQVTTDVVVLKEKTDIVVDAFPDISQFLAAQTSSQTSVGAAQLANVNLYPIFYNTNTAYANSKLRSVDIPVKTVSSLTEEQTITLYVADSSILNTADMAAFLTSDAVRAYTIVVDVSEYSSTTIRDSVTVDLSGYDIFVGENELIGFGSAEDTVEWTLLSTRQTSPEIHEEMYLSYTYGNKLVSGGIHYSMLFNFEIEVSDDRVTEEAPEDGDSGSEDVEPDVPVEDDEPSDVPGDYAVLDGLNLSILGDSISTYKGYSNDAANTNSTIGSNNVYYNGNNGLSGVEDTWWMQTVNDTGMNLLVNNSWSGSYVVGGLESVNAGVGNRAENLHDNTGDNAGTLPDVIAVYMGTNDLSKKVGDYTSAGFYDNLYVDSDGDGVYDDPMIFAHAYAIMLDKITKAYPEAEIFTFTILANNWVNASVNEEINAAIQEISAHYGATVVDIYAETGITAANAGEYMLDNEKTHIHPNEAGMDLITEVFKKALLEKFQGQ